MGKKNTQQVTNPVLEVKAPVTVNKQQEEKDDLICGIIMPISKMGEYTADHWNHVKIIISEAIENTQFKANLVSDSEEASIIQNNIIQNIYNNEIVVCDVSGRNPNVMFELGMRLAFDKPTIVIKDNLTVYPFDIAVVEYIEYPVDLNYCVIQSFKDKLKDKIEATYKASLKADYKTFLKHFGQFKIAHLDEKEITSNEYIIKSLQKISNQLENYSYYSNQSKENKDFINTSIFDDNFLSREFKMVFNNYITSLSKNGAIDYKKEVKPQINLEEFIKYIDNYKYDSATQKLHVLEFSNLSSHKKNIIFNKLIENFEIQNYLI